jgi:predicted hydrocarbon binding protein
MMLNPFLDKFIYTSALKYVHNNFYLADVPFLLVPADVLAGSCNSQDKSFDKLLYYSVKKSVLRSFLKQFDMRFGLEGDKSLGLISNFFTASGWGGIDLIDINRKAKCAIISVSDSPVAAALRRKVKYPADHILRGIFAATFSDYFKKPVDCVEIKCAALGNKNCEFVIKKAEDFNFSNALTRRQLEV